MHTAVVCVLAGWVVLASAGSAQPAALAAFPDAEGFGAFVTGGRGGDVVVVDTLDGHGAGSLGAALDPNECRPRVVVFRISGVIEGDFDLTCGDVTIAGQTAPGAGITIRGRIDGYGADPGGNVIIRHLRVRAPPPAAEKGGFHDAIQLSNNPGIMLDHVSASWAADEVVDLFENTRNVTVQWSTIEESRTEGHPEGQHNYGLIAGPDSSHISIHHTLFAHHRARCPALGTGPTEVVNVVVYNCKDGFVHHNPAEGEHQIVASTFRRGPDGEEMVPLYFDDEEPGGVAYYLSENSIDDPGVFQGVVDSIWDQPYAHPGFEYAGGEEYAIDRPTEFGSDDRVPIAVEPPDAAFSSVVSRAGAFPRDAVTARTIAEVTARTGSWGVDSPTHLLAGLIPSEPPMDADGDGMADDWEEGHGLDPSDGHDHRALMESGYSAIEEYINELADRRIAEGTSAPPDVASGTEPEVEIADASSAGDEEAGSLPDLDGGGESNGLEVAAIALAVAALVVAGLAYRRSGST